MKKENENKEKRSKTAGPGYDCQCPICIFTKSNAPGDSYDIRKCPHYNAERNAKKPKK